MHKIDLVNTMALNASKHTSYEFFLTAAIFALGGVVFIQHFFVFIHSFFIQLLSFYDDPTLARPIIHTEHQQFKTGGDFIYSQASVRSTFQQQTPSRLTCVYEGGISLSNVAFR